MYHGIILDMEFVDLAFPETFKIFAKRKSHRENWILYGIEVEDKHLNKTITQIQNNMRNDKPYYAHLYNDKDLIVIFKDKVFFVLPHASSWLPIINYGKMINIPKEQLDFWPNRFQDEIHYFAKEDFIK